MLASSHLATAGHAIFTDVLTDRMAGLFTPSRSHARLDKVTPPPLPSSLKP